MKFFYVALMGVLFGVGLFAAFETVQAQGGLPVAGQCPQGASCVPEPATVCPSGQVPASDNGTCSGICCAPSASDSPGTTTPGPTAIENPLRFGTIQEVLGSIWLWLSGAIVTLSLIFLIIGAVLYVMSGGSERTIERAKKMILAAAIGLAIALAAPTFLKEIATILGLGEGQVATGVVDPAPTILDILFNILKFLLGVFGVIALIMLIVGGLMFITGGGSERQVDRAKRMITYAVVGIIVGFGSLVIINFVAGFFS